MSAFNKVIWSEGLFLRPQHLQQQDRYVERYIEARCQSLVPHGWGLTELEIDRDLLSIGKLGLRRASGVFPDGTPFRMPDDDPLPAPIDIGGQVRDQSVSLALPLRRSGAADIDRGQGGDGLERLVARQLEARDVAAASSIDAAEIEVGALRTRLLIMNDVTEAYACVPLAHVVECRADKQVVVDDRFIPTVLDVRAAVRLATFGTELVGLLHQRGEALGGRVSATSRGAAAEIADFLMLQAINRYEPLLAHYASGRVHPEELFRVWVSVAGELATFTSPSKRTPAFATYRHDRLRESFEPVMAALRAALGAVLEQAATPIPIESKKFGLSVAMVADKALFANALFILAARADLPAEELRRRFPAQIKIGPVEKIRDLVNLQLPGLPISPVPVAPRQIPFHAGFAYFELDQSNDLWKELAKSGGIAMHVAGEFPGLVLEFWAIRG